MVCIALPPNLDDSSSLSSTDIGGKRIQQDHEGEGEGKGSVLVVEEEEGKILVNEIAVAKRGSKCSKCFMIFLSLLSYIFTSMLNQFYLNTLCSQATNIIIIITTIYLIMTLFRCQIIYLAGQRPTNWGHHLYHSKMDGDLSHDRQIHTQTQKFPRARTWFNVLFPEDAKV